MGLLCHVSVDILWNCPPWRLYQFICTYMRGPISPIPQHKVIQPLSTDRLKTVSYCHFTLVSPYCDNPECLYLCLRALACSVLGTVFSAHSPLHCLLWSCGRIQSLAGCPTEGSAPCWLAAGVTGSSLPHGPFQMQLASSKPAREGACRVH